jgi:two-component system, chemotaxis family, protein-glutamate methylesterase/glutaminase
MRELSQTSVAKRSSAARPIRVMLVDDSRITRTTFACILGGNGEIEIVAEAEDSEQALQILKTQKVDIILLDIEMPRRSGIDALPDILQVADNAKVMVVSAFAEKNGPAALKALALGACDTLAKPGRDYENADFSEILLEKVIRLGRREPIVSAGSAESFDAATLQLDAPQCIAIGASTGGIPSIFNIVKNLSANTQCPVFIVQHLPLAFMDFFAAQLRSHTDRPVSVAAAGEIVKPGQIYVAPGDAHLVCRRVRQQVVMDHVTDNEISRYCPSVDVLFSSVAKSYGSTALAIVLSGMGNDGVAGARLLADAEAKIIVQDEASSVVWGMPGAVVREQLANGIMSVDAINDALAKAGRA